MNATLLFDFLLCGCIIADFYFGGKRGWGLNVRLSRGCCLVCGFVGGQPRISSPPAEADQAASPARAVRFKAVGLGWLGGSWMSRQRCAGRRGGKAEFLCGLMGRGWAEALRCRLGVCRDASLSAGSVSRRFVVDWECVELWWNFWMGFA